VPTSQGDRGQEEAQPCSPGKPGEQLWGSGPPNAAPGPLQEPAHTYCFCDIPGSCGLFCHPSGAVCPAGLWHLSFPFSLSQLLAVLLSHDVGRTRVTLQQVVEGLFFAQAKEMLLKNSCKELGLPLRMRSCRRRH